MTHDLASFEKDLQKEGVQAVIRRNENGIVYGMTYINYKNKIVFNGSDLGKEYSAKALVERMAQRIVKDPEVWISQKPKIAKTISEEQKESQDITIEKGKITDLEKAVELLMASVKENNYIPYQLLQKRKRKRSVPYICKRGKT